MRDACMRWPKWFGRVPLGVLTPQLARLIVIGTPTERHHLFRMTAEDTLSNVLDLATRSDILYRRAELLK